MSDANLIVSEAAGTVSRRYASRVPVTVTVVCPPPGESNGVGKTSPTFVQVGSGFKFPKVCVHSDVSDHQPLVYLFYWPCHPE
jgi:hypothetical protein